MATDLDEPSTQLSTQRMGLVTRPQSTGVTPAGMAEQQRAVAEIQAALTVAQARPRDEGDALDRILTTCQRPGVASDASYEYSRGGQDISGPNIRLLEVIAQKWGNIEWGFREMARFPGIGAAAGESVVEAFAWDLESNARRKVQFTVRHLRDKKGGGTPVRDERDIYELVANYAQRRVRTCLENVIPRDIIDAALQQCDETMKIHEEVTPEKLNKLVSAFAQFGVTKDHIEARLQRKIDTMSPAQMVKLRRIFASLKDGVAVATDFFDVAPAKPNESAIDKAKAKMRGAADGNGHKNEPPAAEQQPAGEPTGDPDPSDPFVTFENRIAKARSEKDVAELGVISNEIAAHEELDEMERGQLGEQIGAAMKAAKRGAGSNSGQ